MSATEERRALWLLALGAAGGALLGGLAAWTGGAFGMDALPPAAIAMVNGSSILREEFERALSLVAGDRRDPPSAADRSHVLGQLIDEELLVQHAVASGLLAPGAGNRARGVRDAVVREMVEAAVADEASLAREEALGRYLEELRGRARITFREERAP